MRSALVLLSGVTILRTTRTWLAYHMQLLPYRKSLGLDPPPILLEAYTRRITWVNPPLQTVRKRQMPAAGAAHHHPHTDNKGCPISGGQPRVVTSGLVFVAASVTKGGWLFQDDKYLRNPHMGAQRFPRRPRVVANSRRTWPFSLTPSAPADAPPSLRYSDLHTAFGPCA